MNTKQFTLRIFLLVALMLPKVSLSDDLDETVGVGSIRSGWQYDKLTAAADLIVVATLRSSERGQHGVQGGDLPHGFSERTHYVIESTFDVTAVLKGVTNRKIIDIIHIARKEGVVDLSGNRFASFTTAQKVPVFLLVEINGEPTAVGQPLGFRTITPEYLLFLKRRDDGAYELVSGDARGRSSVRILNLE